jgi:hypothetical protein
VLTSLLPAISVISTKTLGLAPDVNELNAFVAAAGFAEAAVFHGLSDPPFINSEWATAEFTVRTHITALFDPN